MEHCCLQRGDLLELARVQPNIGPREIERDWKARSEILMREDRKTVYFRLHKYNMNYIH